MEMLKEFEASVTSGFTSFPLHFMDEKRLYNRSIPSSWLDRQIMSFACCINALKETRKGLRWRIMGVGVARPTLDRLLREVLSLKRWHLCQDASYEVLVTWRLQEGALQAEKTPCAKVLRRERTSCVWRTEIILCGWNTVIGRETGESQWAMAKSLDFILGAMRNH